MANISLDITDRKLLNLMQVDFPLTVSPYASLGLKLGVAEDEIISRIRQLKEEELIRQLSPVFDIRRLGYQATLVALRAEGDKLPVAERVIIGHPGISHGYERDHYFNLWFTLVVPPGVDMTAEIARLVDPVGIEAVTVLPALRLFKISTFFNMDGQLLPGTDVFQNTTLPDPAQLSQRDRLVVNGIQQDLPLLPRPFAVIAEELGLGEEELLAEYRSLKRRRVIRRFAAFLNHNRAGYWANAMTCWAVPPDMMDTAGRKLAALREVSHCYERATDSQWRYNLFAMIHSHTPEVCREIAAKISSDADLKDYAQLFSTKEFKKVRLKYLV